MRPVLIVPPPLPVIRNGSWFGAVRVAVEQAGGGHQYRVVEERRLPLGDLFHPLREVGELRDVELVRLEVHRFLVGGPAVVGQVEMQRALHAFQELEIHLRQVVVEHQRRDARLVHLEREHDQIEHQLHVIGDVLRQLVRRPRHVGLRQRRPPAFDALFLRCLRDALLDVADGFEVLAQLLVVAAADLSP